MTRALVLRPEPGNAATVARLRERGIAATGIPLFRVEPVAWEPPAAADFDALLLTSANAVRHAGPALSRYAALPVIAVGDATARAARAAGLGVAITGSADVAAALAQSDARHPLHLAGVRRRTLPGLTAIAVYDSVEMELPPGALAVARNGIVLLHSPRAATIFARLTAAADRPAIAVATFSPAVARAAGDGWRRVAVAPTPDDDALTALVAAMIDPGGARADKPAA